MLQRRWNCAGVYLDNVLSRHILSWQRSSFITVGFIALDDSFKKTMCYHHFSGILRAVQLDFFLDVLSREGKGMEKLFIAVQLNTLRQH